MTAFANRPSSADRRPPVASARAVALNLHSEIDPVRGVVTTVVGELDVATAPRLIDHLGSLAEPAAVLDLRGVPFVDAAGLRSLVRAHECGARQILASRPVERLIRLCEIDQLVDVRPSGAEPFRLDSAPFAVAVHDGGLRYVYVNSALSRLNQLPEEAHRGHRGDELFDPVEDSLTPVLQRVLDGGRSETHTVRSRIGKQHHRLACYYGPIGLEEGSGIIAVVRQDDSAETPTVYLDLDLDLEPSAESSAPA